MALASKKYEKFYETTGTGKDKIDATKLSIAQTAWATEKANGCANYMSDAIDKTTFPGFGTSSTTALAGDTTTISTAQASAITANTAKVSQGLNTASHTMQFDVINAKGTYTLRITVVDSSGKAPVTKTVDIRLS